MTPERWSEVKGLFLAVAAAPEPLRAELLGGSGADPEVVAAVQTLLGHRSMPPGFLEEPALGASFEAVRAVAESGGDDLVGARLGPYLLEASSGTGGMGTVYRASRADGQFEQTVAIKIVKRGLDTDEILGRFRRERRLLARLEHPGIARLFDGGVTPDGRPYLVMEHVAGRPIDRYCAEEALSVERRLELFCAVCGAVHFAHQHLVVHRDLKPGNILVTKDGAPKLLDFGIAKLLSPDTGPEITAPERRLLTPGYASPEQVLGLPVSTASDVYSLGVVLYRILAGEAPYSLDTATDEEVRRLVCETDPPPPRATAARNGAAGHDLRRRLRGDLDNIVLMAMRKEPERRYASAEQFAADIRRHLSGHPVIARPSTLAYRARKFIRRNTLGVAAGAALALALGAGVVGIAWQARVAQRERDAAILSHTQADQVNQFLQSILQSANAFSGAGHNVTVRELLDGAAERARADLAEHPIVLSSVLGAIGSAYTSLGAYADAEPLLRQALSTSRGHPPGDAHLADHLNDLATLLYYTGATDEAERLLREALELETALWGRSSEGVGRTLNNLGAVLRSAGRADEAEAALREALDVRRKVHGPDDLAVAETLNNLSNILRLRGDLAEAGPMLEEVLRIRELRLSERHPLVAQSLSNLAVMYHTKGDLDGAAPLYARAIPLLRANLGPDHPALASTLLSAGLLHRARPDEPAAEVLLRESLQIRRLGSPDSDARLIRTAAELGRCLSAQSKHEEAVDVLSRALDAAAAAGATDESYGSSQILARVRRMSGCARGQGRGSCRP